MYTKESLKNSTLTELRQIAENLKLEGYQRLKKEFLVEEIIKNLEETNEIEDKVDIQIENPETDYITEGILEVMPDGYGFLRSDNYLQEIRMYMFLQYKLEDLNLQQGIN